MCFGAHLVFYKVYWKFPTSGIKVTITVRLLGFKDNFYKSTMIFKNNNNNNNDNNNNNNNNNNNI